MVPNKDTEYLFTAISNENKNYFKVTASTIVQGIKTNKIKQEITNPPTSGNIHNLLIVLIISFVTIGTIIVFKDRKNNN